MQGAEKEKVNIEGVVDEILFTNPANGYNVLELDCGDRFVTVVGLLGDVVAGEE